MLQADRSQFEALCADQLSYGHSASRVENKAQFIDAATSRRSTWKFITLTDQTNQIVGNNAIVRHTFTGETERDGKIDILPTRKRRGFWDQQPLLARARLTGSPPREDAPSR